MLNNCAGLISFWKTNENLMRALWELFGIGKASDMEVWPVNKKVSSGQDESHKSKKKNTKKRRKKK